MGTFSAYNFSRTLFNGVFFFPSIFQLDAVLDLITGGSRSTTPVSLNSRKSPTAEMGVQVNQKDGTRRNNNRGQQGGRLDSQGSHENRVSCDHFFINFFHTLTACVSLSMY